MTINILHLYPKEMNLYGDHGNVLCLKRRLEWRSYKVKIIEHEPGDELPKDIDIIFGGGGQDSGQSKIEKDLQKIGPKLKEMVESHTPTLVICGLYQLFGKYFKTSEGQEIKGVDILDITTDAGNDRIVGNITIDTRQFGKVVGYENHSGLTKLGANVQPFGAVVLGGGNNATDITEGAVYKNCIGTYLHGPILPKNPRVADYLIEKALENKTGQAIELEPLDDKIEDAAREVAASRPR